MRRVDVLVLGLTALLAPGLALAQSHVWIYDDGETTGYTVPEDFEFYEVEPADIHETNHELMAEILGYGPHTAVVGAAYSAADTPAAEHYGALPDGYFVDELAIHDYLSPGDWRELFGDWFGPGSYSFEAEKSGPHWSVDASTFGREGHVFARKAHEDEATETLERWEKQRHQSEVVWRRGSADGGAWFVKGRRYSVEPAAQADEAVDVELNRVEVGFKAVECGLVAEGAVFAGNYSSWRRDMDNSFAGLDAGGSYWVSEALQVEADARLTRYDLDGERVLVGEASSVDQSQGGCALNWELSDEVTVVGSLRSYDNGSGYTANSHVTSFQDSGLSFNYRPDSDTSLSAGWSRRTASGERVQVETIDFFRSIEAETPPSYEDFVDIREPFDSDRDRFDLRLHTKLGERWTLGAQHSAEQWSDLPLAGSFDFDDPQPHLLPDERTSSSLMLLGDTGCGGNLSLRASQNERRNTDRLGSFELRNWSAGYSAPLTDCTRWGAEVARNEAQLDLDGTDNDWSADSWNYGVNLSGRAACTSYRLSYTHQVSDTAAAGDFDALGLEVDFERLRLSAWWRERSGALGGFADFDDAGISLGYRFSVR